MELPAAVCPAEAAGQQLPVLCVARVAGEDPGLTHLGAVRATAVTGLDRGVRPSYCVAGDIRRRAAPRDALPSSELDLCRGYARVSAHSRRIRPARASTQEDLSAPAASKGLCSPVSGELRDRRR